MRDIVQELYLRNWDSAVTRAATLIPAAEATALASELAASAGWRERVTAAKVIRAFKLNALAAPLVRTFAKCPEVYTARAFAKLVSELDLPDREVLVHELRSACPPTEYGSHLLEVIEKAVSEKGAA